MNNFAMILTVVCLAARVSFGDVWQDLAKYQCGEGTAAEEAEKILQHTPMAQHGAIEDSLIAVVSAGESTQAGRALESADATASGDLMAGPRLTTV